MVLRRLRSSTVTHRKKNKVCSDFIAAYRLFFSVYFFLEVEQVREGITLACTECKNRNYRTNKNKKNTPDRLELRKYCKFCRQETVHRETR